MPKANPKHRKRNAKLDIQSPKRSNRARKAKQMHNSTGSSNFVPKLPSREKLKKIQKKFRSLLFEIEEIIMTWFYDHPEMTDRNVLSVVTSILQKFPKKEKGISPPKVSYDGTIPLEEDLYYNLKMWADSQLKVSFNNRSSISQADLRNCFACIYDSVRFWNEENGLTGYLDYVSQFVPPTLSDFPVPVSNLPPAALPDLIPDPADYSDHLKDNLLSIFDESRQILYSKIAEQCAQPIYTLDHTQVKPMLFQLKIQIRNIRPPVWRRVLLNNTTSLAELHDIIQKAFTWENYHLHEFVVPLNNSGKQKIQIEGKTPDGDYAGYIDPDAPQEDSIWISDCLSPENKRMQYVYDFGDHWEHLITLEKIFRNNDNIEVPICIGGKRAAPPEDCGGSFGYMDLLEDRKHQNILDDSHEEEWLEEDFDPNRLTTWLPFIKEKEIKKDLGVPLFPLSTGNKPKVKNKPDA